jgi:hypothetical protein
LLATVRHPDVLLRAERAPGSSRLSLRNPGVLCPCRTLLESADTRRWVAYRARASSRGQVWLHALSIRSVARHVRLGRGSPAY